MKSNVFFIYASLLLFSTGCANESIVQNKRSFLDEFTHHENFQIWYHFWNDTFPEIDLLNLTFEYSTSYILSNHRLANDKIQEGLNRQFSLNYSPQNQYTIDLYPDVVFDYSSGNDSLTVKGRDADPAFMIYYFPDSLSCYYTAGSTAFFDESTWLTDTTFVILGMSFQPAEQYQQIVVIKGTIGEHEANIDLYLSEELPWRSGWKEYMIYKYPQLLFY
jgi:hypothetical protein